MRRSGLPPIAWALAGLLCLAALLMSLGRQDYDASPEATSYSPSGVSAFCELLRRNGISVTIDRASRPRLGPNDIAVAFERRPVNTMDYLSSQPEDEFRAFFWKFIENGGEGLILPIQRDYYSASRTALAAPAKSVEDPTTGQQFKVSSSVSSDSDEEESVDDTASRMTLWHSADAAFLSAYKLSKGTALVAADGIGITNRFIDRYDNAKAFSSIFSILAKKGKRFVFTEASFGNVKDPGLLEWIGPWASAAWAQLVFLGVVVVFTLGIRFGLPEETRRIQRGSREMLDALADTFMRSRSTQAALTTAWDRADAELRTQLKLPRDASRSERDKLLPSNLQNALARLEIAKQQSYVPEEYALSLIRRAQSEMDSFLGHRRTRLRGLAKLKP
ncbi:MAG: hypothetical protein P4L46_00670 [Fimbriimonas sp.]|nr:hypothetical protein [Fimbriimonas sp.]